MPLILTHVRLDDKILLDNVSFYHKNIECYQTKLNILKLYFNVLGLHKGFTLFLLLVLYSLIIYFLFMLGGVKWQRQLSCRVRARQSKAV